MKRAFLFAAVVAGLAGCSWSDAPVAPRPGGQWARELEAAGVSDVRVLKVMNEVKRVDFLPRQAVPHAREDRPLAIGYSQTTSQPSLIARMIEELRLGPDCKVLEVGTGSGYQTALLARLCRDVYSIEIVEPLAEQARERLARLGHTNAHVRAGDGYAGWPEAAPFDGIVVCAATAKVPQPLVDQLAVGGRLVIPLEDEGGGESLAVLTRGADGTLTRREVTAVRFVPLTGERAEDDRR
jgi:protein-L-isoaspartate(D-aspartate) O-methyltransferase